METKQSNKPFTLYMLVLRKVDFPQLPLHVAELPPLDYPHMGLLSVQPTAVPQTVIGCHLCWQVDLQNLVSTSNKCILIHISTTAHIYKTVLL